MSVSDPDAVASLVHEFVMSIRAWGSGDFHAALSSRSETERGQIVDELFQRMETQVRADPTVHKNDLPVAYIMVQKLSDVLLPNGNYR